MTTEGHLEWRVSRRRAVIVLSEEAITRIAQLPPDWLVLGVHTDFATNSILVMITGPEAPLVPEGTEAPRTPGYINKAGHLVFHYDELPGYGEPSPWVSYYHGVDRGPAPGATPPPQDTPPPGDTPYPPDPPAPPGALLLPPLPGWENRG